MAETWQFRRGTLDQMIFNDVVSFNEYRLPDCFAPGDIVIDGGAHIGCFAHAAVMRGCETVYSIEPDPANYAIATKHLRPYIEKGFVRLMQRALWRSDPNDDELRFDGYHAFPKSYSGMEGIINTGNGSVVWGLGEPVPKIAFDELVDTITDHGAKRVRLLKLDCEGAEWPIVLTSRRLHLLDEICGEFHEIGGQFLEISEGRPSNQPIFCTGRPARYTIEELVRVLNGAGFTVTYRRHRRPTDELEGMGLFFAKRTAA
jgi:FkbM family methyltransferase